MTTQRLWEYPPSVSTHRRLASAAWAVVLMAATVLIAAPAVAATGLPQASPSQGTTSPTPTTGAPGADTAAASPAPNADASAAPVATPSPTALTTGTVTGRITNAVTGEPVARGGAWVWLFPADTTPSSGTANGNPPGTFVQDDGRYTVTGPVGTWRVSVGAPDPDYPFAYLPRTAIGPTPETQASTVVVQAGVTATVDIALTPAGRVEGRVVTSDGAPVPGAELYLRNARGDVLSMPNAAPSGPDGSFVLYAAGVPIPAEVRVLAHDVGPEPVYTGWFTIGPMQVVTGVVVTVPAVTPTPTPSWTEPGTGTCTSDCGGGGSLAPTGRASILAKATAGLAALLLGAGALLLARRRSSHSH